VSTDPNTLPFSDCDPTLPSAPVSVRLESRLSPEALWSHLEATFTDSRSASLWVNDLSTVRLVSPTLAKDAIIAEQITGAPAPVHYRLVRFDKGHLLEYRALEGHPLKGGATVEVAPTAAGSELRWEGVYQGTPKALARLDQFSKAFFRRLGEILASL